MLDKLRRPPATERDTHTTMQTDDEVVSPTPQQNTSMTRYLILIHLLILKILMYQTSLKISTFISVFRVGEKLAFLAIQTIHTDL